MITCIKIGALNADTNNKLNLAVKQRDFSRQRRRQLNDGVESMARKDSLNVQKQRLV